MNEIKLKEKNVISLENVKKIVSITPREASLTLDYASIIIKGEGLEIEKINEAQTEITIKGTIKELIFDNGKTKNHDSFFKKLFQ